MTPTRYPLDFIPWAPGRTIGFAGTWHPISTGEREAVAQSDAAIMKALIDSAMEYALRKGGRNG